jgi:integrase
VVLLTTGVNGEGHREVLATAETHPTAVRHDIADLLWFLDGTGVRISEALAVRWDDLDLETGALHVRGTKTDLSDRYLTMPTRLCDRLSARLRRLKAQDKANGVVGLAGRGVVFQSPGTADRERPRNRYNTIKLVRRILDAAGMPWATSHAFRHAVITRIVEAGQDVGRAADQAGHSDLRTTQAYIGRKRDTSGLRDVL